MTKPTGPTRAPSLFSPWRRLCQWGASLLLLLTPWINVEGNSLLRIDIPGLTLHLFGQVFRIEELYLVLLFSLALALAFLLTTMVLGRVWCGWFCPQTTLTDLSEWFSAQLDLKRKNKEPGFVQKLALQSFNLALAFLVAANLLWYFIEPQRFFIELFSWQLHYASAIALSVMTLTVYLDLALLGRIMCRDFCPYGRFQTTLSDQSTLTLQLPPQELERCIKCESCVRVCPMEIDIRQGYQAACINCGRCLDACRTIMAKRSQPGLISYAFGTSSAGPRALLNLRTCLLGMTLLGMIALLSYSIIHRPSASLKIERSRTVADKLLKDGQRAIFFNAWIKNRGTEKALYSVSAFSTEKGHPLTLKGQINQLSLEAGENRKIDLVLVTAVPKSRLTVEFILSNQKGDRLASSGAYIKEGKE